VTDVGDTSYTLVSGANIRNMSPISKFSHQHSQIITNLDCFWNENFFFRYLLSKNVEVNSPDENGITPLAKSVLIGDQRIVQMLLSKGADANIGTTYLDTINYWTRKEITVHST